MPEADELADALTTLFDTYPTDAEDAPRTRLVLAPPDGPARTVSMQPGQLTWITRLVEQEFDACRRAHPDQTDDSKEH